MLLRLQNNIKSRLLQAGRAEPALRIVQTMLLLAPDLAGLWHEAGMLNARLGNMRAAVEALQEFIVRAPGGRRAAPGRRAAAAAQVEAELSPCRFSPLPVGAPPLPLRQASLPQFVALDFAGRGLRQAVGELDPARVFPHADAAP